MQNSRIGWRKRLAASIACALVAALSFSGMEMTASADEQTDGSQAQGVHAVNNADVPVIEPDSPEAKLYSLPDEAADDDSEDATADDAEEDYDPEDFFADAAPLAVNGQDRSAGDVVGPSNHSREDGLWTLSVAGEVTHVTYDASAGRYVPDASRDIPFWTRSCTPNYGISGGFSGEGFTDNRGVFDGLAVSSAKKDATTMYAVHSYSNTTTPYRVEEANSGVALYRYREGHGWNTWRITGYEGNWKITEQRVQWNGSCAQGSSSISASYNPSTLTPNSATNSPRNYTFDSARTNFSGGAIINAGTPQEAYIFGGTDSTQFQGNSNGAGHGMKIFSFQPGNDGNGVVKYLGYIPIQAYSTPQSVYSGFTTDAEGNVYAAVGQKWGGNNLNLKVYKLTNVPAEMNNIYDAQTGRQFTFGADGHWGGSYNFNNQVCGALGGTPNWQVNNSNCTAPFQNQYAKEVVATNISFTENVDGFTGITIAPDKHVTVGVTLGNSHHGKVVEIKENQTLVDEKQDRIQFFDSLDLTFTEVHKNNGGILNILHTDIEGVLYGKPAHTLKLVKKVVNRKGQDQFVVDLNPTGTFSENTAYRINSGSTDAKKTKTNFTHTQGQETEVIRNKTKNGEVDAEISVPAGFTARLGERTYDGSQKVTNVGRYNTTLECSTGVEFRHYVDGAGWNRYYDIVVTEAAKDENLTCTLVNTAIEENNPPVQRRTFAFKKQLINANASDEFTVIMNSDTTGVHGANGTTVSGTNGVFPILTWYNEDTQNIPSGNVQFRFIERASRGSLADYNTSLSCIDDRGSLSVANGNPYKQGNYWQLSATIPANAEGNIVCTLVNEHIAQVQPQTKVVTLYKKFDRRYKNSDNFKVFAEVPLSYPINKAEGQTNNTIYPNASATTPLAYKVFKKDAVITVGEIGVDGASLDNYDTDVKCTEGGFNGRALPVAANVGRSKQFNLATTNSSTVDCYVINTARTKVTIHKNFNRRFADSDNFTVTATNMNKNKQEQSVTGATTGTGTDNQGQDIPLGKPTPFSNGAYLKVAETGVNSTNLSNYNTLIKCTDGGLSGRTITATTTSTDNRTAWFNLQNLNLAEVDCYVTNTVPEPERTITVKKLFKNDTTTAGFSISGYFGTYSNAFNMADTSGHNIDEPFTVTTAPKKIPKGQAVLAVFNEGARPDRHIESYDISVVCKGEGADPNLDNITDGKTVKITGTTNGNSWEGRGTIPAKLTGSITCTLINEKPANTKVVLFKQLKRYGATDQFNVSLKPQGSTSVISPVLVPGSLNSSLIGDDYLQYKVSTVEKRPKGQDFQFKIEETAQDGADLANYTSKVTCKAVNEQTHQENNIDTLVGQTMSDENGTRSVSLTIPQAQKGEVHCYLRNEPKPKGSITIHKISSIGSVDLAGSQWKIQKRVGGGQFEDYGIIADNDTTAQGQIHDDDSHAGYIKIANLQVGTQAEPITYKVIETVAPVGFTISKMAAFGPEITLDGSGSNDRVREITNAPAEVPDLPFTGGLGTIPYMLGGLSVLLGAIAVTTLTGGKRRKQN